MSTEERYYEEDERIVSRAIYFQPNQPETADAVLKLKDARIDSPVLRRLIKVWHACSIEGLLKSEVIAEKYRVDGGNLESLIESTEEGPALIGTHFGLKSSVERIIARTLAPRFHEAVDDFSTGKIAQSELLTIVGEDCECSHDEVYTLKEAIERAKAGVDECRLKTGFKRLDKATRGLTPNRFTILASRPGVGKSDFALAIAHNTLRAGKKVFLASLEMDSHEVVKRLMRHDENSLIGSETNLQMDCAGRQSVARIAANVRRFMPDLVIIDYLQILDSGSSTDELYAKTSLISNQLRAAAKGSSYTKPAAWLVLSQLSRLVSSEKKQPELSHLRDSGAIEQDADTVLFLHEPTDRSTEPEKRTVQLTIAKNRSGERGFIEYEFNPSMSSWNEAAKISSFQSLSSSSGCLSNHQPA